MLAGHTVICMNGVLLPVAQLFWRLLNIVTLILMLVPFTFYFSNDVEYRFNTVPQGILSGEIHKLL